MNNIILINYLQHIQFERYFHSYRFKYCLNIILTLNLTLGFIPTVPNFHQWEHMYFYYCYIESDIVKYNFTTTYIDSILNSLKCCFLILFFKNIFFSSKLKKIWMYRILNDVVWCRHNGHYKRVWCDTETSEILRYFFLDYGYGIYSWKNTDYPINSW